MITILVGLILSCPICADDWPQFRGPDQNGISPESDWSWLGPIHWTRDLGLGYSSPTVGGGIVYTMGFDEPNGVDVIYALSLESGETLWGKSYPSIVRANFHGGGTLSTPTLAQGVLYTCNHEGQVYALNAENGGVLWHRQLVNELGLTVPFHGFSASPVFVDTNIIVTAGGVVLALDPETGETSWRHDGEGGGAYSTPVLSTMSGQKVLLFVDGRVFKVLQLGTGEVVVSHPWQTSQGGVNASSPVLLGSRIFLSSGYNKGCALLEPVDRKLQVLWENRSMRTKVTSAVAFDEFIYGFDESILKCLDNQGVEQWRYRGLGMGSLSLAGGRLLIASSQGELIVADANPKEYRELGRRKVLDGGSYWTPPVISGGLILLRNSLGSMVCLNGRETGEMSSPKALTDSLPDPWSLFQKHLTAIGGESAWSEIESLQLHGTIEVLSAGSTRSPVSILMKRPSRYLMDYLFPEFGQVVECFDGEVAWKTHPFEKSGVGDERRHTECRDVYSFDAAIDFREIYGKAETLEVSDFEGNPSYVVRAESKAGVVRTHHFDTRTGFLLGRNAPDETRCTFGKYRLFGTVFIPSEQAYFDPDTGEERRLRIESVSFDDVKDEEFAAPYLIQWEFFDEEKRAELRGNAEESLGHWLGTYQGKSQEGDLVELRFFVYRGRPALQFGERDPLLLKDPDSRGVLEFEATSTMSVLLSPKDSKGGPTLDLTTRGEVIRLRRGE